MTFLFDRCWAPLKKQITFYPFGYAEITLPRYKGRVRVPKVARFAKKCGYVIRGLEDSISRLEVGGYLSAKGGGTSHDG